MPLTPYRIALATRGAGAFSFTWLGVAGLPQGKLAAVRFRKRLEVGLVVGEDPDPPQARALEQLVPLECTVPDWGSLLLELSQLACSATDELLPRLTLGGSASGLRLELRLAPDADVNASAAESLAGLSGVLTPKGRQSLLQDVGWQCLTTMSAASQAWLTLAFTGQPGHSRAGRDWRRSYQLDHAESVARGLPVPAPAGWPGAYLAGLASPPHLASLPRQRDSVDWSLPALEPQLGWDEPGWPPDWDIVRRWPGIAQLPLRRTQASLPLLSAPDGVGAELTQSLAAGERVLLLAPQNWMLDSLWPRLAPLAPWLMRHRANLSAGRLAQMLLLLEEGPGVVAGTEAAWRLPLYSHFDRVLLLDPSHPQWGPEARPWLDPRCALLLACARRGCRVDIIELGLSAFDWRMPVAVRVFPPHTQPADGPVLDHADTNPLPYSLRDAGRRRLVYFNRLGASRGLICAECQQPVVCPQCKGHNLHYSSQARRYICPDCGLADAELRCQRCGLGTLAARLPGLEAVRVRAGELLVGGKQAVLPGPESTTVLGTSQLLEPAPGYWPQEIVYIDPEERDLLDSDWRSPLDMAARLTALYANRELERGVVVSSRIAQRFADELDPKTVTAAALQEEALRRLGGLPPYGPLYKVRASAASADTLRNVRAVLGDELSASPGTSLLRLGRPYPRQHTWELAGLFLNPELDWSAAEELRWRVQRLGAVLALRCQRGPWL